MSSPVQNIPTGELFDPSSVTNHKTDPLPQVMGRVRLTNGWQHFMSDASTFLQTLTTSGTTAQRPTKFLYVGRPYFDTTLGFQIHYNGTVWVDGSGTPV